MRKHGSSCLPSPCVCVRGSWPHCSSWLSPTLQIKIFDLPRQCLGHTAHLRARRASDMPWTHGESNMHKAQRVFIYKGTRARTACLRLAADTRWGVDARKARGGARSSKRRVGGNAALPSALLPPCRATTFTYFIDPRIDSIIWPSIHTRVDKNEHTHICTSAARGHAFLQSGWW